MVGMSMSLLFQLKFCVFVPPQKRKRREKDESDSVSLCSFDFKVKHIQVF